MTLNTKKNLSVAGIIIGALCVFFSILSIVLFAVKGELDAGKIITICVTFFLGDALILFSVLYIVGRKQLKKDKDFVLDCTFDTVCITEKDRLFQYGNISFSLDDIKHGKVRKEYESDDVLDPELDNNTHKEYIVQVKTKDPKYTDIMIPCSKGTAYVLIKKIDEYKHEEK